jgi:hypothetical protein
MEALHQLRQKQHVLLCAEITRGTQENSQLKAHMVKEDALIREKEDLGHRLKMENQKLEKHKAGMDFHIKEFKINMTSWEELIMTLKNRILALPPSPSLLARYPLRLFFSLLALLSSFLDLELSLSLVNLLPLSQMHLYPSY